jgi:carboxypeptidase Q
MKKQITTFFWILLLLPSLVFAQRPSLDEEIVKKIKEEGSERSQVMDVLSMLTDVHGPRLTNSPGYKRAANYAKTTMDGWGLSNVHFDSWGDFGQGWQLKKFSMHVTDPVYYPVIAYPKAWTPGIKGTIKGDVVYLDVKTEEDLDKYKGKLKGKIVLFSMPVNVTPGFRADASRTPDSTLLQMANAGPVAERVGRRAFGGGTPENLNYKKWKLMMDEGVVAVLDASRGDDGTVFVSGASVPYSSETPFADRKRVYSPDVPKILPQITVAAEHYNRMYRNLAKGQQVKMELALEVEFFKPEDGFNVIAEIPGTDLKDEVVMIGAHLDSWHSGTGTTDNAAGSAVMMEAMRILKSLGVSPRRTIRIGLWGGEEQGLLGSRGYVAKHLGTRVSAEQIDLKPAAEKFSAYFNMDNGTGKFRGVYMQENENVRELFREWMRPFNKDGASTLTLNSTFSTDHVSFDNIGLPGFQFIQDPVEYFTRTWHSSMDLYDKAIADDLKHNAMMMAVIAWHAAMHDELVPRK